MLAESEAAPACKVWSATSAGVGSVLFEVVEGLFDRSDCAVEDSVTESDVCASGVCAYAVGDIVPAMATEGRTWNECFKGLNTESLKL
jgi:hypothetical protein